HRVAAPARLPRHRTPAGIARLLLGQVACRNGTGGRFSAVVFSLLMHKPRWHSGFRRKFRGRNFQYGRAIQAGRPTAPRNTPVFAGNLTVSPRRLKWPIEDLVVAKGRSVRRVYARADGYSGVQRRALPRGGPPGGAPIKTGGFWR